MLPTAAREDEFEVIKDKAGRRKKSIAVYTTAARED